MTALPDRRVVVSALGITQIFAWGSTFYLPAALAPLIASDTGWPYDVTVGGVSVALLFAGLASPRVGRLADNGGRPVLAVGALLLAAGLIGVGFASSIAWYLAGWLVIGLGMSASLYDAAFSTLGRIYGTRSRTAITAVTLFGGFASTVCWPLRAFFWPRALAGAAPALLTRPSRSPLRYPFTCSRCRPRRKKMAQSKSSPRFICAATSTSPSDCSPQC
jgi:MFS family permease